MSKTKFLVIGIFLLFYTVYSTSEIFQMVNKRSGAFFFDGDEVSYATRLARTLQGHWGSGAPWLVEHQNEQVTIPTLIEDALSIPSRLGNFDLSPDFIVKVSRGLFPALTFLALLWVLLGIGTPIEFSIFLSAFVLLEANPNTYLPFSAWLSSLKGFGIERFWNPMAPLTLFFLTLGFITRAFLRDNWKTYSVVAGVGIGLSFYTSVFYWTHLILGLVIATLFLRSAKSLKIFSIISVFTALVASFYLISLLKLQANPVYADFKWRNALLISERAWYYLWSIKQWVFTAIAFAGLFSSNKNPGYKILIAFMGAGILLLNSSLFLGKSIQNYHWHHQLAPLIMTCAFLSLSYWLKPYWQNKKSFITSLLVLAVLINASGLYKNIAQAYTTRAAKKPYMGIGIYDPAYFQAWDWLKKNAEPDSVVLSSETTMSAVPIRSGLWVWAHPNINVDLIKMQEIYERYQVLWYLEGLSGPTLIDKIKVPDNYSVPSWPFGLPLDLYSQLIDQNRPVFNADLRKTLYSEFAQRQSLLTEKEIRKIVHKYHANYLVLGPNENFKPQIVNKIFKLKKIKEFGPVEIDEILD